MMSTPCADRWLIVTSAAVALFAVAVRLHDIVAFPVLRDFDAAGHALNVVDLYEGHLPDLRSWCGSHPPLYYAFGALLWTLLPEGVPVHVMLRSISVVSWVATVALVWRTLRRISADVDAAVVAALLLGVPGILIASCMMTNDSLCTLLVTATLVRLLPPQGDGPPTARHAALTGVLAGLAALTKAQGVWAVGMAAAWYAWRSRRSVRRTMCNLLALGGIAGGIAALHYGRFFLTFSGSLFDFMTAMGSPEKRAIVTAMLATGDLPHRLWPLMLGILYLRLWSDPSTVFLSPTSPAPGAMIAVVIGGIGVLSVAVVGAARLLVRREVARLLWAPLAFGVLVALLLALAFSLHAHAMTAKPTFVQPAVLPVGLVLAFGLGAVQGIRGTVLRAAFLALAAGGAALSWYGWGAPNVGVPPITLSGAPAGSAVHAVERYFRYRAEDPIRAQPLLDAQLQRAHGLRVARLLGLSVSPEGAQPAAEASALDLAQARVAWMELYDLVAWLQPVAAALAVTVVDADEGFEDAWVNVRITAAGSTAPAALPVSGWPFAAFEQRFTLRRSGREWRITAIEQHHVSDENALAAFVASPTMPGLERLRSLGWQPGWGLSLPRTEAPPA